MATETVLKTIGASPLANKLTSDELKVLAGITTIRPLETGETLSHEGEEDSYLYVVVSGSLDVKKKMADGSQELLCRLGQDEIAGISGFVDGQKRLADMVADGETTVLAISREQFRGLVNSHPEVVYKVMCTLVKESLDIVHRLDDNIVELDQHLKAVNSHY